MRSLWPEKQGFSFFSFVVERMRVMTRTSVFPSRLGSSSGARLVPCIAVLSFLAQPAAAEVMSADAGGCAGNRTVVAKTGDVGPSLALVGGFTIRASERAGDSAHPCRTIESVSCRMGRSTSLLAAEGACAAFRRSLAGEVWGDSRIARDAWMRIFADLGKPTTALSILDAMPPADMWEAFTPGPDSPGTISDSAQVATPLEPSAVPSTIVLAGVGALTSLQ
jgi:hypothetical protein